MKSFGVPYFSPVAPRARASKDLIIRHPIWQQKRRPDSLNSLDKIKAGKNSNWYVKKKREGDNE
jgi:spore germination protein KA